MLQVCQRKLSINPDISGQAVSTKLSLRKVFDFYLHTYTTGFYALAFNGLHNVGNLHKKFHSAISPILAQNSCLFTSRTERQKVSPFCFSRETFCFPCETKSFLWETTHFNVAQNGTAPVPHVLKKVSGFSRKQRLWHKANFKTLTKKHNPVCFCSRKTKTKKMAFLSIKVLLGDRVTPPL